MMSEENENSDPNDKTMGKGVMLSLLYSVFTLWLLPFLMAPKIGWLILIIAALVGWAVAAALVDWYNKDATSKSSPQSKIAGGAYFLVAALLFFNVLNGNSSTSDRSDDAACNMPSFVKSWNKGTSGANRVNCN
ncbi:MAG: hypothetical protein VX106_03820 [Pseudomonadota bacterium]|nr:hypothetical protein [Pseudomonadota bacterium]